jgi:hypothetical protein
MPLQRMSRRNFVWSACSCCAAIITSSSSAAPSRQGCFLTATGRAAFDAQRLRLMSVTDNLFATVQLSWSTGRPEIDRELDRAIKVAASILEVKPAFAFYDADSLNGEDTAQNFNAFADTRDANIPGTRGVVGFGHQLFRSELYGYDESGTTVMCIVSHEFGHVLQSYRGYLSALGRSMSSLAVENNADFLSGYYLGVRKQRVQSLNLQTVMDLYARIGRPGNGKSDRDHGNSEERVEAVSAGFRIGVDQKKTLNDAVRESWRHVSYNP